MLPAEDNELRQALQFDRLNETLAATIYTRCQLQRIATAGMVCFG